ncbi:hypothetical protein JCM11491_005936 [Sporobolomyces phaffii]
MDELTGLPLAFGKAVVEKKQFGNTSKIAATKRVTLDDNNDGVPRPTTTEHDPVPSSSSSSGGGDLPTTHEVVLKDHLKTVSALSMDPAGARMVTGSYDYDVKIWDFGGMKADFKPFRSFESRAGHQIVDVAFSISGDSFLVANGSDQVKHYDRDGAELGEFVKGDMYIRDLRHTSGHVAAVSSVAWHPTDPSVFATASSDSTVRVWDKANRRASKSTIVVKSKVERGGKTKVTAVAWSRPDGKLVACASEDGSLMLWKSGGNFSRPDASNDKAHAKGTITSSIAFSPDGKYLATRGGDGTVKLWNPKSLKKAVSTVSGLASLNSETSLAWSPDGKYVLTGTAGSKAGVLPGNAEEAKAAALEHELGQRMGQVVVLAVGTAGELTVADRVDISEFSVVKVVWHPKINQILCSTSQGAVHVLYSPDRSTKGALLGLTRTARTPTVESTFALADGGDDARRPIIAPHSLPMFKDDVAGGGGRGTSAGGRGGKRKRERERHDPQKTLKPTPPITGPGRGGRVGASATQHVVQGMVKSNLRDQDPREALLKYATADPADNTWTSAWSKTQPKAVFDDRSDSDDDVVKERPK